MPPSIRDFFAFEQHVATARRNRGSEVPKEWYEFPVFYFTNPAAVYGPGDDIRYPEGTSEGDTSWKWRPSSAKTKTSPGSWS